MKDFLNPKDGLSALLWETKFILTLFLLFNLAGYVVMGLMIASRTGFKDRAIKEHYLGNEENEEAGELKYKRSYNEMLEVSHFHIYSIPLLLFVQGHLFMLCGWPRKLKAVIVLAAFAGGGLQIGAPWLVWNYGESFVWAVTLGRVLLLCGFVCFTLVPLWSMWQVREHRTLKY